MNAALVNAIAERMWRCWEPLKPIEQFVIEDATAAAEAVAEFVAALPASYSAADVLAAMRGEDVDVPMSPDKGHDYVSDSPLMDRIAAATPVSPGDDTGPLSATGDTAEARIASDRCPKSQHVDGAQHAWRFDGDDPYIRCNWCGEVRDTLTGRVVREATS